MTWTRDTVAAFFALHATDDPAYMKFFQPTKTKRSVKIVRLLLTPKEVTFKFVRLRSERSALFIRYGHEAWKRKVCQQVADILNERGSAT